MMITMATRLRILFPFLLLILLSGAPLPPVGDKVDELQAVFGPEGIKFDRSEISVDLKGDGHPQRVILLADRHRGLELPKDNADFLHKGARADGFVVFDGMHPDVVVFYQYLDYGGFQLRFDAVEGHRVLVADGGSDHIQRVWGWWKYPEAWPVTAWEGRQREYDTVAKQWGKWAALDKVTVFVGK
jgi:hypothetical protein